MSLTFLTPLMLAGMALVAAPVVLHLVMRRQPKHLVFPALRFIQQRNDVNKRRLKLRHWLLLALRCAAIVFLALALARPSLQSAGWLGDQEAPVAAALVFDTSPRMQYRHQNRTRLEEAQQAAERILTQLPAESQVAIVNSQVPTLAFAVDGAVARQRVDRLSSSAAPRPLPELCEESLQLLADSDKARKEIYVFTDLCRAAWSPAAAARLRDKLAQHPDVACYLVDVGVVDPRNLSLTDLRRPADALAKNTPLRLESELACIGPGEERNVGLWLVEPNGKPEMRAQTAVTPTADGPQAVEYQVGALKEGTQQGFVRVAGEDSLAADDVRYFTVEVRPPWKVLVAAPEPAGERAVFFTEAIAPDLFRRTGRARFECEVVPLSALADKPFDEYTAVCLLDPTPLSEAAWKSLTAYVEHGGGLAIWLGRNAQPKGRPVDDFNHPAAKELLPGKLSRQWHGQDAFLAPPDYQHPLLARFRSITGGVPWDAFTVWSHWQFTDLSEGVNTVVPYSNGQAAVLEKSVGKGRVLVMTTPISDEATEPDLWNLLPVGSEPWPFVMLTNEMLLYLVGSGEERLNYLAGETVTLKLPEEQRELKFSLRTPEGEEFPQSVDLKTGLLTITSAQTPGNYLLRSGGTERGVRRGFSVNIPAESTQLARLEHDELTELLGKDRFRLSRGQQEIERDINLGRTGRELYPLLIMLLAIVLGLEYVVANKFYRREREETPRQTSFSREVADTKREAEPVSVG